ncbi:MAG: hypothetical protein PHY92_02940 [Alphaproteobacteria bacterium]|nr:hypothetical protein [Alphaproteobacteria bacterium]
MISKEAWGYLSLAVSVAGYIPYFRAILNGRCKPHVFSWVIWAWAASFLFVAQCHRGAGAGAWVTGLTALACLAIAVLALKYGEKRITQSDEVMFGFSLAAMPLWIITDRPLWSVILLVGICAFGFFPTLRKSYGQPHEELIFFYASCALKSLLGLLALENYVTATALYPLYGVIANGAFVGLLFWRRGALAAQTGAAYAPDPALAVATK